jgi:hypothetical protein
VNVDVTREQVLAYRVEAQGLHRTGRKLERLAVLDFGVQDAAPQLARLAFDARLPSTPPSDAIGPGRPLALVWSLRGAPDVHRREDLDAVAAALYPMSEQDAGGRINETGPAVQRAGIPALEQFSLAVSTMRSVVTKSMGKGAVSTAVTKELPPPMRRNCRACGTSHISDSAMRASFLPAGLELEPDTAPPVLRRRPTAALPKAVDRAALRRLVLAYLTLLGPASEADAADYFGIRRADLGDAWPESDLIEVRVDKNRPTYLPKSRRKALESPREPDVVRLLGPFDPYLQARDRDVLVPDKAAHKTLWPVLGRPGALLVDGEIAGTWRGRASGGKLTVQIEPFGALPDPAWSEIETEAERVAAVRDLALVGVKRS